MRWSPFGLWLLSALFAIWASVGHCATVATLQMTNSATFGATASINPSSAPVSLDAIAANGLTIVSLPNALFATVTNNFVTNGEIDLHFNLIVGSETFSKTLAHTYDVYSQTNGSGALGADAEVFSQTPIQFSTGLGIFTIVTSDAGVNLLGKPLNTSAYAPLSVEMSFAPVREPSTLALLALGGISILCAHRIALT
jgi:hypothetical protein